MLGYTLHFNVSLLNIIKVGTLTSCAHVSFTQLDPVPTVFALRVLCLDYMTTCLDVMLIFERD